MIHHARKHLKAHFGNSTITVLKVTCPGCDDESRLTVPTKGFGLWLQGSHIQEVMPDLSAFQREQLITGYCQKCWDEMWENSGEEEA